MVFFRLLASPWVCVRSDIVWPVNEKIIINFNQGRLGAVMSFKTCLKHFKLMSYGPVTESLLPSQEL